MMRADWSRSAFDIYDGTLYCARCDDIVYDDKFDQAYQEEKARVATASLAKRAARMALAVDPAKNGQALTTSASPGASP